MNHPNDLLPLSPAVSALVRRITMRLSCELAFHGHQTLSQSEVCGFFDLGDASAQLDRLAMLPGMGKHEERARRDLLELFDVFHPFDPLEATQDQPRVIFGKSVLQSAQEAFDTFVSRDLSCKSTGESR